MISDFPISESRPTSHPSISAANLHPTILVLPAAGALCPSCFPLNYVTNKCQRWGWCRRPANGCQTNKLFGPFGLETSIKASAKGAVWWWRSFRAACMCSHPVFCRDLMRQSPGVVRISGCRAENKDQSTSPG